MNVNSNVNTNVTTGKRNVSPTPATNELESLKYDSLEYLIVYLKKKGASKELLLLLLQKYPSDVTQMFDAIRSENMTSFQTILASGTNRTALPTGPYYEQIVNVYMSESDETLATDLLRYLVFFPMEKAHPTAIPYLIEQYMKASPDMKRHMIDPYCWSAVYIPVSEKV